MNEQQIEDLALKTILKANKYAANSNFKLKGFEEAIAFNFIKAIISVLDKEGYLKQE